MNLGFAIFSVRPSTSSGRTDLLCPFQVFATDLSDPGMLERARAGLYPESIVAELTPERLQRFFKKEDHLYRIDKSIRDSCIFARQNLCADPPFSHVDLISCRNVLIYMNPAPQRQVLPTFHYALNVPGFRVLGSSETVGDLNGLFEAMDRANKVYRKLVTSRRPLVPFAVESYRAPGAAGPRAGATGSIPADFQKEADRLLLSRYAPPGVLVNERLDILQFRGRTGPYLEAPPGEPTMNLLKMARPGLFVELRSAVNEALARGETVRREGLQLRDERGVREVAIEVLPVRPREAAAQCCLVFFDDAVVQAIQGISQTLGLRTIAESVESETILERVRAIGIDFAQGYTPAEPSPLP